MGIRPRLLLVCLLASLCLAAPAHAAITASNITSPANGSELFFNGDNGTGAITVSGTVTGATTGTKGDIVCLSVNDTQSKTVVSGVDVSSGSFAINVSLSPIADQACRLAMIPAGSGKTGNAAAPYTGPAVSVSALFSHSSQGSLFGYYILSGTLPWSFAFQSLGDCPITNSYATDPGSLGTFALFAGDACLPKISGVGVAAGTRSSLQIDGLNAYAPAAVSTLATQPGFEPLQYSALFNASHDVVVINETDIPTICNPPATFPPTTTTCPSFHDSGIQVQQLTRLQPGGNTARVTQRFVSVDGRSHAIDALFSNAVEAPSSGESPGFEFPGQPSFATHSQPDSFAAFPAGPGSIIAIGDASGFLPATSNPIGAITYSRPPTSVDFVSAKGARTATMLMHYMDTVPAGGSVTYDWSFSQASSVLSLTNLEALERDHFGSPILIVTSPSNGATVTTPTVHVQGRVVDSLSVSSLSVGGHSVPIGPGGGVFNATVKLTRGRNTIIVTARNAAQNTTTKAISVTYALPPCKVPKVRGMTLSRARHALTKGGCAVGHVKRQRSRKVRKGRVISSTPGAGKTRKRGTKVALVLSSGR